MSRLDDPNHYQHTTAPTVPPGPTPRTAARRHRLGDPYRPGDRVTLEGWRDGEPYVLQFQRQATISRRAGDEYMIHLGAVWPADEEFGPFPMGRLLPGWFDPDGRMRCDIDGMPGVR